jgi:hypothetical protein
MKFDFEAKRLSENGVLLTSVNEEEHTEQDDLEY